MIRAVIRGLLWGLLAVVVLLLAVTGLRDDGGGAAPEVLGELPPFSLIGRDGGRVALEDLRGEAWVADFIFTRCPGPCPLMTRRMAELGERLPPGVRRVSFTVDPGYDTPEVLAAYADRHDAPASWLFLTGSREAIWQLSSGGFKLAVADAADVQEAVELRDQGPILHSTRFVLVDGEGRIRGYYDAFEGADLDRLVREARAVAGG